MLVVTDNRASMPPILWCCGSTRSSFVAVLLKKNSTTLRSQISFHRLWPSDGVAAQTTVHSSCRSICPAAINLKAVINAICCAAHPLPANHNLSGPTWKVWCHNVPQPNIPALVTADCQRGVWAEEKPCEEPDPCWHSPSNDSIPQTRRWPQLPCTV